MSFLAEPLESPDVRRLYDGDRGGQGYVMNLTRVWAHHPPAIDGLSALLEEVASTAGLTFRQKGILVSATAGAMGDSYCALAWGARLARAADEETAAGVLTGDDSGLAPAEQALARWARQVTRDPTATTEDDVAALREAGLDDRQVLALTTYVALRRAFSTVNAALGARPDGELVDAAGEQVRDVVRWGRPAEG